MERQHNNDGAGLELEQNLEFQARRWRATRVAWAVLLILMAATLAGLFGKGPISSARAGDPGSPFYVEYGRFGRFGASMRLEVHLRPDAQGRVAFALDRSLTRAFRVNAITPNPRAVQLVADGVQYEFDAPRGGGPPVIFELQPAQRWHIQAAVRSPHGVLRFWQFIYP